MSLAKQMGIASSINRAWFTADGSIKSREQANMLKEKLIAYLCKVMVEENQPDDSTAIDEQQQITQPQ